MIKNKAVMSWQGFASIFGLLILIGFALNFQACAPRSATMCINQATNDWVKCPAGVQPGTTIETTAQKKAISKQATKKQTTKKRTTTKKR